MASEVREVVQPIHERGMMPGVRSLEAKIRIKIVYRGRVTKEYFVCGACQEEVGFKHRFCPWCGHALAEEPNQEIERKIV
jgi:rRNA maturation endonuclease Nob1